MLKQAQNLGGALSVSSPAPTVNWAPQVSAGPKKTKNYAGATKPNLSQHRATTQGIMAAGQSPPAPTSSNPLVAEVIKFKQSPSHTLPRHMRLNVIKAGPPKVDAVIDAIQRYLNIAPRREATSDPKNEASIARHPQQIIESYQHWGDALPYQYAINGATRHKLRPDFHAWGGTLQVEMATVGPTDISVGPPMMTDNPYFDPAFAAQNAIERFRENTFEPRFTPQVGAPNYVNNPHNNPALAAQNAMARTQENLQVEQVEPLPIGPPMMNKAPQNQLHTVVSTAVQAAAANNHDKANFHRGGDFLPPKPAFKRTMGLIQVNEQINSYTNPPKSQSFGGQA
ncbi:MAG: hypothetical protein ACRCTY_06585 [Candidatus Adiutrix sp.]